MSEQEQRGGARVGERTSGSVERAQEIRSVRDKPDSPGRALVTTSHDVIRDWAERREAVPASVPGSEHQGHRGVLRLDFPGYGGSGLERISWDEWFAAFDARELNFLFQEQRTDGSPSNFFQLESPHREQA